MVSLTICNFWLRGALLAFQFFIYVWCFAFKCLHTFCGKTCLMFNLFLTFCVFCCCICMLLRLWMNILKYVLKICLGVYCIIWVDNKFITKNEKNVCAKHVKLKCPRQVPVCLPLNPPLIKSNIFIGEL